MQRIRAMSWSATVCYLLLCASACAQNAELIVMPNFGGKQLTEATSWANEKGIVVETKLVDSVDRRGSVVIQIPPPDSQLSVGQYVYFRVSDGVIVPDIKGLDAKSARTALKKIGVQLVETSSRRIGVEKGVVAVQFPDAGSRIDVPLQTVFLVISEGRDVVVPDVVGQDPELAEVALRAAELVPILDPPGLVRKQNRGGCLEPLIFDLTVTGTTPTSKTKAEPSSSVVIHFSSVARPYSNRDLCPEPKEPKGCGRRPSIC